MYNFEKRAADALECIRKRGLTATLRIIWNQFRDASFDREFGVETASCEDPRDFVSGAEDATLYLPSRARAFRALLHATAPGFKGGFVDYGCGKGRTLILAAEAGFEKIKGIELVPEWAALAADNIKKLKYPSASFEIICRDARFFQPCAEDTYLYFYDPFSEAILQDCLRRIQHSIEEYPRPLRVTIHHNLRVDWQPVSATLSSFNLAIEEFHGEQFAIATSK